MNDTDGKPDPSTADDTELAARLRALDRRLDERRPGREAGAAGDVRPSHPGMAMAMRLAADFVAGVLLGGALGLGFDRLFGTSPWGLMVFVVLGFAAGVLSMLRSAGMVATGPLGHPEPGERRGLNKRD